MHRAQVREDFIYRGVAIRLCEVLGNETRLRNFAGGPDMAVVEAKAGDPPDLGDYTLLLRDDEARALWEELSRHFGASPVALTDRADLLAERVRVDKLTDAVIRIAVGTDGSER